MHLLQHSQPTSSRTVSACRAACPSWPTRQVHGQVYRVLTAALMHGGLLHLTLNMMALVQIGSSLGEPPGWASSASATAVRLRMRLGECGGLRRPCSPKPSLAYRPGLLPARPPAERRLGSLPLLWAMLLVLVLGDGLYVGLAYLWALLPLPAGLPAFLQFMRQCAVGLSGVLFGLVSGGRAGSDGARASGRAGGPDAVGRCAFCGLLPSPCCFRLWQLLTDNSS